MKRFDRNDIVITFGENPTYYVNESKKTVVCVLTGRIKYPDDADCFSFNNTTSLDLDPRIRVTTTAKCSGKDVFNISRGKRIALTKAENKAYAIAKKRVEDKIEELKTLIVFCNAFVDKADKCIAHNEGYISELSDKDNPNYIEEPYNPRRGKTIFHN